MPQPLARILILIGGATFALAVFILLQARRQISFRIMVGLPELEPQKNKQIVLHEGIYSRTRNPIYLAHWLLVFSAAVFTNYAANWIGFAIDCLILPSMIRSEERELLARHGQTFTDYMRRVPRFFPQLR
jgi:protein-S-isoprenylcysteine O-methyltransferase Ste14